MSALIDELEFWGLVVFLSIGAAFVLLAAVRWTGGRAAGLLDKALQHEDEQKQQEDSGKVK